MEFQDENFGGKTYADEEVWDEENKPHLTVGHYDDEFVGKGGQIEDRYKLGVSLGKGGFGEVFLAFDMQNDNQKCAIKIESKADSKEV